MNKNILLTIGLLSAFPVILSAQSLDYTRSWLGSSFNGPDYTGNFIDKMEVSPDGTVHTYSGWDEINGGGRTNNYKDGQILNHTGFSIHTTQITDKSGKTWTIINPPGDTYPSGNDTIKCSDGRTIADADWPTALAIAKNGMLMVGEYGPRGQVRYYDISGTGTPVFDHAFGESGGFLSGSNPGSLGPLRFREIKGVGEDENGNIYVGMSSFYGGCKLQSYSPSGNKNWELNGLVFVDNGDFDPTTDGKDIYTKSHHYVMDYSKPAGQQWTDTAYTLNRFKYPDDARIHNQSNNPSVTIHPSSTWVRNKDGHKIIVVNDMFTEQLRIYRFNAATDGEIAIPSVLYAKKNVKPFLFNFGFFKLNNDTIQALKYCHKQGTQDEKTDVGSIIDGDFLAYCNINFTGKSNFTANTTSPFIGGILELHADSMDGRIIGADTTSQTGGWVNYKSFSTKLTDTITGIHDLYIVMKYPDSTRWPVSEPDFGEWLWTDSNGNGQMDAGEYQTTGSEMASNGFWVDKALNIWMFGSNIIKIPFEGFDAQGNPKYSRNNAITTPVPAAVGSVLHLEYDSDSDKLYIVGATTMAKISNWSSGNKTPDWVASNYGCSQSMCFAGDYLFLINVPEQVYTFRLSDGKYVGKMEPFGKKGIIDIPYGIRAIKRNNGEYVVLAEEDYLGQVLIYRFSTLIPNQPPVVNIKTPTEGQQIVSAASITITATASDPDGTLTKVQIFLDDSLVSNIRNYSWLNAPNGSHTVYARAFDDFGDSTTSDKVHFSIVPTGINSLESSGISVYPNPVQESVFVKLSKSVSGSAVVSINDLNGKPLIISNKSTLDGLHDWEVSLSGVPAGIYILKLETTEGTFYHKLIKN